MNKIIVAVIVIIAAGLAGFFLFRSPGAPVTSPIISPSPSQTAPSPIIQETPSPSVEQNVVVYTDAGYSPSTLRIKKGETVIFKNQSSRQMQPASAVHPIHRGYPTTGGCIGSTFDACREVQSGDSWSFKFDIAGSWKFHDHLIPGDTGTIVVE